MRLQLQPLALIFNLIQLNLFLVEVEDPASL
jgi:hypothetical protein